MNSDGFKAAGAYVTKSLTLLTLVALLLAGFLLKQLTGTEPAIAGCKLYIVMSGSMEPALKVGSIVGVNLWHPKRSGRETSSLSAVSAIQA